MPPPLHPPPLNVQTPGFAHYSLAWSPFHNSRLALASSANYGLVGNGRLHIVSLLPGSVNGLNIDKQFDTQDGLFDVAWSEIHENQLAVASGDGSIKLFDVMINVREGDLPIRIWHEHTREAFSVDWSNIRKDQFMSCSWEGSIKIWTPELQRSVTTIPAHQACVYQALYSPHLPDIVASCSADGTLRIFDIRAPVSAQSLTNPVALPALTVPGSATELLTLDWNKYQQFYIATGGVDKVIRVWDCRMIRLGADANTSGPGGGQIGGACEAYLAGHEYAVRKVNWSPHRADVLASASYDMTCRIWTTKQGVPSSLLYIHDAHSEFVSGCAWSLYDEGILGTCAWDCRLNVFRPEF
ncbi:peroxin 7 [Sistotremastrum suecicum HHB10207 ss-3]|uniref:Peroxin-7 n=1 Tax=Sistotremastrum suecicum HHB10207 ss-3 TaxID=1314776 RepID=A0A166GHB7_9AGAM|nr:peroxin 7 [Sistotremastrum suecicum HHB10207 ss-3]